MGKRKKQDNGPSLFTPRCAECGEVMCETPSGYWACGRGHGRLVTDGSEPPADVGPLTPVDEPEELPEESWFDGHDEDAERWEEERAFGMEDDGIPGYTLYRQERRGPATCYEAVVPGTERPGEVLYERMSSGGFRQI